MPVIESRHVDDTTYERAVTVTKGLLVSALVLALAVMIRVLAAVFSGRTAE